MFEDLDSLGPRPAFGAVTRLSLPTRSVPTVSWPEPLRRGSIPAGRSDVCSSEANLRQILLESQPQALFLLDRAGLVLEVGGAWESLTGLTVAEARGRPLLDWVRFDRMQHPAALWRGAGVLEEAELLTCSAQQVVRLTWIERGPYVSGSIEPLYRSARQAFDLAERLQQAEQAIDELVHFLGVSQDAWQAGHIRRIVDFAGRLGVAAGLPSAELRAVRWGAALHDIGKARVPQEILQKAGPLDALEYEVVVQHPAWGVQLLADLPFLPSQTLDAVRHHHERWDGRGYPLGLSDQRIPLAARIVSIVDVFDALTSVRPYKGAWTYQDAVDYLIRESGQQFDPQLTRLFVCEVLGFRHLAPRFDAQP